MKMAITNNTARGAERPAALPNVSDGGGGKRLAQASSAFSSMASGKAGTGGPKAKADTGKRVDAQGLLNAFSAKGLEYDGSGLALKAGDAANVVVAANGGSISGKQLDSLLKGGFVRFEEARGTWGLDQSKLTVDQRHKVFVAIVKSTSFNKLQKSALLQRIGISPGDQKAIDQKAGNRDGELSHLDLTSLARHRGLFTVPRNQTQLFALDRQALDKLGGQAGGSNQSNVQDLDKLSNEPKPAPPFRPGAQPGVIGGRVLVTGENGTKAAGAGYRVGIDRDGDRKSVV